MRPSLTQADGDGSGRDGRGVRRVPLQTATTARSHRRATFLLRRLAVALALLGVVVTAAGFGLYRYYEGKLGRVSIPGLGRIGGSGQANGSTSGQNFLLAGSDTRGFAGGQAFQGRSGSADFVSGQRSDTVILVHLPRGNGKAELVSFPRDSYVDIPAFTSPHGTTTPAHKAKLNEAFSLGGPDLLVEAISSLTGLRIDHYVQVNFAGFRNIVTALDGLTLCIGTSRHDHDSGDQLTAGVHTHVSGDAALAFVRDRKGLPAGDIDRIKDQQYFLSQVLHKVLSTGTLTNPVRLNHFLTALAGDVTVDSHFGFSQITTLASRLRHLDPAHVSFLTLPILSNNARRLVHGVRQSVVLVDQVAADRLFVSLRTDQARATPTAPPANPLAVLLARPSTIRVRVLNGTAQAGLAARTARGLRADGFRLAGVGTTKPVTATLVRYGSGEHQQARTVAAALPGASLAMDTSLSGVVVVVLGPNAPSVIPVARRLATPTAEYPTAAPPTAAAVTAASNTCAP